MKTILAPLLGTEADAPVLKASQVLAQLFDSHIDCLHVSPDPAQLFAASTAGFETALSVTTFSADLWDAVVEASKAAATAAEKKFKAFAAQGGVRMAGYVDGIAGISAEWHRAEGDYVRAVTKDGLVHDVVVIARSAIEGEISPEIGSILSGCGRPILLAPPNIPDEISSTVAIAWKDTAEAARAVTAAMPLLKKCKRIVVLRASEDESVADAEASASRLADQLRWHGFKVQSHHVPPDILSPAEAIMAVAGELGVKLVVMGGYGRSRAYEFIFGGFTRYVLGHARLPVLLTH